MYSKSEKERVREIGRGEERVKKRVREIVRGEESQEKILFNF